VTNKCGPYGGLTSPTRSDITIYITACNGVELEGTQTLSVNSHFIRQIEGIAKKFATQISRYSIELLYGAIANLANMLAMLQ